jgi:hypothetical protein
MCNFIITNKFFFSLVFTGNVGKKVCTSGFALVSVIDCVIGRFSSFLLVIIKGICDEILDTVGCLVKRFVKLLYQNKK